MTIKNGFVLSLVLILFFAVSCFSLEVFKEQGRIEIKGEVSKDLGKYAELQGEIEYLACAEDGKAYESILVLECKPGEIHEALLDLGLKPGSPASLDKSGKSVPPKGPGVTLMVEWKGKNGKTIRVRAEDLICSSRAKKPMTRVEWVFTGSRLLEDPETGKQMLQADMTGNIVATHHVDPSVILQNPLGGAYKVNEKMLPKQGTKVKLIIDVSPKTGFHLLISGKVQGVGFRAFTRYEARGLGIVGYVKNLPDGDVEIMMQGREFILNELIKKLKLGPPGAKVKDVKIKKVKPTGKYKEFKIVY